MFVEHYKPRNVSEITKTDDKIVVVGKVVEVGENSFILDDDTGKVQVVFEGEVKKGKLLRVFCSLAEEQLKADIVQDLKGLDLNLFKEVKELYSTGA